VQIEGRVDGTLAQAGHNRMRWQSSEGAIELREWLALGDAAAMRVAGQAAQLEQCVPMIEGRTHGLPGHAEALAVQQTIEDLLAGR